MVGNKSLDAEIYIDLVKGDITFDYSSNAIASPYNSNTSAVKLDEFGDLPLWEQWREGIRRTPVIILFILYNVVTTPIVTWCMHRGYLKRKEWQVEHQKLLKWFYVDNLCGKRQIIAGPLDQKFLRVWLQHNMWFEYNLDGDFKDMVTKISLVRHYDNLLMFGKYNKIRQDGWDIEFQFCDIPQTGKCTIDSS